MVYEAEKIVTVVEEGEEVAVGSLGTLRRARCIIPCRLMLLHLPRHSYNVVAEDT